MRIHSDNVILLPLAFFSCFVRSFHMVCGESGFYAHVTFLHICKQTHTRTWIYTQSIFEYSCLIESLIRLMIRSVIKRISLSDIISLIFAVSVFAAASFFCSACSQYLNIIIAKSVSVCLNIFSKQFLKTNKYERQHSIQWYNIVDDSVHTCRLCRYCSTFIQFIGNRCVYCNFSKCQQNIGRFFIWRFQNEVFARCAVAFGQVKSMFV